MAVTMTPAAAERVQSFMQNRGKGLGLRLGIKTTGCSGLAYVLEFVDDLNEDDQLFNIRFAHSTVLVMFKPVVKPGFQPGEPEKQWLHHEVHAPTVSGQRN